MGSFVSCEKVEFLCKFIGLFIVLCPASFGTHTLRLGSALQLSKCTCAILLWMSVNLSIDLLSFVKKTKEKLFKRFFNLIISKIFWKRCRFIFFYFLSVSLLTQQYDIALFKVHIFWEGFKILQNLPLTFDCMYCSFAKFCGLLRIYELCCR